MQEFLIYELKVAALIAVFYLFYRILLGKETLHRLSRVVLIGTAVLSFILPLCVITVNRPLSGSEPAAVFGMERHDLVSTRDLADETVSAVSSPASDWWLIVVAALYFAGVAAVLVKILRSLAGVLWLVRRSEREVLDDGSVIVLTDKDISPCSWMKYIILGKGYDADASSPIVLHEKAHVALHHSADVLAVDVLTCLQWFNPAIWLLRSDLRAVHEYEADEAVLSAGIDAKSYQYLLVSKAMSDAGYTVANSFNGYVLKSRITMMLKKRTPGRKALLALYVLPVAGLSLLACSRSIYVTTPQPEVVGEEIPLTELSVEAFSETDYPTVVDGRCPLRFYYPSSRVESMIDENDIVSARLLDGKDFSGKYGGVIPGGRGGKVIDLELRPDSRSYEKMKTDSYYRDELQRVNRKTGLTEVTASEQEALSHGVSREQYASLWEELKIWNKQNGQLIEGMKAEGKRVLFMNGGICIPLAPLDTIVVRHRRNGTWQMSGGESLGAVPTYNGLWIDGFAAELGKTLKYRDCIRKKATVVVSFIIDRNFALDPIVVKGVDEILDREAVRAIKSMPGLWKPAVKDGKEVETVVVFPVEFIPDNKK